MDVNFSFLADYADNRGGKITAVGIGIDTIYARKVPIKHALMFAVISIKFSINEVGQKTIGMRLIDQDGTNIIPPIDTSINVTPPLAGILYRNASIALALNMVEFQNYGNYSVRWLLEGQEISSVPLRVANPPVQPTTK